VSKFKQFFRPLLTVLLLIVTALGLINVYGDSAEVVALAQKAACRGGECPTRTTRIERTPFGHEYDLAATLPEGKKSETVSVTIRCKREYVLLGDWACSEKH
jgi:hypothetical protein